jgi:hypothetical protein
MGDSPNYSTSVRKYKSLYSQCILEISIIYRSQRLLGAKKPYLLFQEGKMTSKISHFPIQNSCQPALVQALGIAVVVEAYVQR